MRSQKERKHLFIKGFLLVLLGVAISELLLSFIYNSWIFPLLRSQLKWEIFSIKYTSGSALYRLFSLFGWFLIQGAMAVLPSNISIPLRVFYSKYIDGSVKIEMNEYFLGYSDNFLVLYYFGCLIILLFLLYILLLPYITGAWIYSRMINKQLNLIQEEEKKQYLEMEQRRSLMLSDIAHDLKTPITTISGYAQALSEGMVAEENKKKEYLDAISRKSNQMDQLIQILYEYVKLDSQEYTLKRVRTDIAEFLRENVAAVYPEIEEKNMEIEVDIPEIEIFYLVDRIQFSRAVSNLLTNAVRHNEEGTKILVRLKQREYSNCWSIWIGDTGGSIAKEVARHIFEPFVMGDESRNSKGGSGLGMSISHKIVQMHGWNLLFEERQTVEYTKAFVILLDIPAEVDKRTNHDYDDKQIVKDLYRKE